MVIISGVPIFRIFMVINKNFPECCVLCTVTKLYKSHRATVKILKFGTAQTIAIIVLKIEKFDVTLH